ncbi:MAG: helix-turn-helix transcriptional regulator [Sphaerochaetaceae bacterium]|nr:helix-turn-helix transcriptional regulator [Sphaerochaetaceae bacterium]
MNDFWKRVTSMLTSDLRMTDISRITGIPRSTISNWIRRGTYPSADCAEKIADVIGVTVSWLVTGQDAFSGKPHTPRNQRVGRIIAKVRALDDGQVEALEPVVEYIAVPKQIKKK